MTIKVIIGIMILVLLVIGARYKFDIGRFFNEYEEECFIYETIQVSERYCDGNLFNFSFDNETIINCIRDGFGFNDGWINTTQTHFTDKCLKYHLVRVVENDN